MQRFGHASAQSKHAPVRYRLRATGLSAGERVLFDPWFSAWRQETEWAAMITFWRAHHRAAIIGQARPQPYLDAKGELGTLIFHAPSTRYVREGLLDISKGKTSAEIRAYCLDKLKAANKADKRIGLTADPLL